MPSKTPSNKSCVKRHRGFLLFSSGRQSSEAELAARRFHNHRVGLGRRVDALLNLRAQNHRSLRSASARLRFRALSTRDLGLCIVGDVSEIERAKKVHQVRRSRRNRKGLPSSHP